MPISPKLIEKVEARAVTPRPVSRGGPRPTTEGSSLDVGLPFGFEEDPYLSGEREGRHHRDPSRV